MGSFPERVPEAHNGLLELQNSVPGALRSSRLASAAPQWTPVATIPPPDADSEPPGPSIHSPDAGVIQSSDVGIRSPDVRMDPRTPEFTLCKRRQSCSMLNAHC